MANLSLPHIFGKTIEGLHQERALTFLYFYEYVCTHVGPITTNYKFMANNMPGHAIALRAKGIWVI